MQRSQWVLGELLTAVHKAATEAGLRVELVAMPAIVDTPYRYRLTLYRRRRYAFEQVVFQTAARSTIGLEQGLNEAWASLCEWGCVA